MIGVFDSGEGGENTVRHLRRLAPRADIALFTDRAHLPYGTKSADELTRLTESLCIEKDIPHSMIAAPQSTGTNATSVNLTACGVPTVDVGLPLASMHTYTEVISERDCESLSELVKQFICSRKISEKMSFSEVSFI